MLSPVDGRTQVVSDDGGSAHHQNGLKVRAALGRQGVGGQHNQQAGG